MKNISLKTVFDEIDDEKQNTELAMYFVLIRRGLGAGFDKILLSEEDMEKFRQKIDFDLTNDRFQGDEFANEYIEWIKNL